MNEAISIKQIPASKSEKKNYGDVHIPPWLIIMYKTIFFIGCKLHQNSKKSDVDHFCIDCCCSMCFHCLPSHTSHKFVKIRRYVYSDVINRRDLYKLFNCSGIQAYHTNKAKVIFLKQRPQNQHHQQQNNSRDYNCIICERSLQDPSSLYCSIACKVETINEDGHKEKQTHCHNIRNNVNGGGIESSQDGGEEEEEDPTLASLKRRKIKRKRIPQRAPLF